MTTAQFTRAGADMRPPRPPTITLAAMVVAPMLLLASTIGFLTVGNAINDGVVGGVLTVWAVLALALAFIGCSRLIEPNHPRGAQFVLFGAAAMAVGGSGFGVSGIFQQILRDERGLDAAAAFDSRPFALLALLPWGWFVPITCIVVGALLWRAATVPWWHGVLFILGGALFVTGRPAQLGTVAVATDLILIAAFGLLAVRIVQGRVAGTQVAVVDAASRS